jgi:hypothetical protein
MFNRSECMHRLPEIKNELYKSIEKVQANLRELPREPSRTPQLDIATMLQTFVADLSQHVQGVPEETGLVQRLRPHLETFRRSIRLTVPRFSPRESNQEDPLPSPAEFLTPEEKEEEEEEGRREGLRTIHIDDVMRRIEG